MYHGERNHSQWKGVSLACIRGAEHDDASAQLSPRQSSEEPLFAVAINSLQPNVQAVSHCAARHAVLGG